MVKEGLLSWNEYLENYVALSCTHTHALSWYTLLWCFLFAFTSTHLCCSVLPSTAKNHSNRFFSGHLLDVHQKNSSRGINKRWQRELEFWSHLYTHLFDYPSSFDDLYLIKISVYVWVVHIGVYPSQPCPTCLSFWCVKIHIGHELFLTTFSWEYPIAFMSLKSFQSLPKYAVFCIFSWLRI